MLNNRNRAGGGIFGPIVVPVLLLLPLLGSRLVAIAATDQSPVEFCRSVGTDDRLRPPPPSLAEALQRAFNVSGAYALETSYYRCDRGMVMLCAIGANLVCGKANTSTRLPAANRWCRDNRGADLIPLVVTGHDTIFEWACARGKAVPKRKISTVDDRGFISENWKPMP